MGVTEINNEIIRCQQEMNRIQREIAKEEQKQTDARNTVVKVEDAFASFSREIKLRKERIDRLQNLRGSEKITRKLIPRLNQAVDGDKAQAVRRALERKHEDADREIKRTRQAIRNLRQRYREFERRLEQLRQLLLQAARAETGAAQARNSNMR